MTRDQKLRIKRSATTKPKSSSKNALAVESVTDYLEQVFALPKLTEGVRCFRGESDAAWLSKPSIMRGMRPNAERHIFSELMLEAPVDFSNDKSMFDKLVRAQHYGLPTRLLDVSLNPLVSLYFACNEQKYHDKDGAVKVFNFVEERMKFADSDTVSLICNLTRLSDEERKEISDAKKISHAEFNRKPAVKRLLQFVRSEKPYFLPSINPIDLFRYFFVHPIKNNRRVIAQSGAFVAAGLVAYKNPLRSNKIDLREILIPKLKKGKILEELDLININSRTLFPEIEFTSKYIKNKWTNPAS